MNVIYCVYRIYTMITKCIFVCTLYFRKYGRGMAFAVSLTPAKKDGRYEHYYYKLGRNSDLRTDLLPDQRYDFKRKA